MLVVDDDRGVRRLLRQILEQEGYAIIEAQDGEEALKAFQRFQPSVVLLDGLMPVMDGFECCQRLQFLSTEHVSVIMITRLDDPESIQRAFAAGAIDYVIKPIHPLILRQKVSRIMRQTLLMRQLQQTNLELEQCIQINSIDPEEGTNQFRRALALETMLKRITDRVRDSLDETQILQGVVDELAAALGAIRCNAGLYSHEQRVSNVYYEHTTDLISYRNRSLSMDKFSEIYQPLLQGSSIYFCPIRFAFSSIQSSMFVFPIKSENQTIGDIWLVCNPQRTLDELEIRLVKQVANQCAIAIRQARLYQASQAQVKELEQLNQIKDDFLSVVSHELRSPMSNIRMAVQMLEKVSEQARERYGDTLLLDSNYTKSLTYLQIIQAECEREINFINDLLDLQRLEAKQQPLTPTFIDLEAWLFYLVQPFWERAQQRKQNLHIHVASALPPIESDVSSLDRIVSELLHNACKYTPPGEAIMLSVNLSSDSNCFQISITNTGVEIPMEECDRIFDKFYRIPNSDRWNQGGTGLGLALVKRMVECLGGSIQLETATQQTCFTVQLPARKPELD